MMRKISYRVHKFRDAIALVSLELFLVFIAFAISASLLIIVIRQIFYLKNDAFDERVFQYLSQHVSDINTSVMQSVSFLGSQLFLVPAWLVLLIIFSFVEKNKWYVIKMLAISLSTLLLMLSLKFFFNRPRPLIPLLKEVPGLSFPSGHAFMSFVFYGVLIYIVSLEVKNRWLKGFIFIFLSLLIFSIGLSRVYLRVHYASDVIAGFCFGLISLILLLWMLRRIEKINTRVIPQPLNPTKTETQAT
jgi:undecaprenyl-diphosphatase